MRVLLCARDMADGGDWMVPHYLGQERLRKPPLMYWLVASAFRMVGSSESLGAARAVSALCAIALVLVTFFMGRQLLGRRAAFLGAFVLATSLGFLCHGRLAETDIPLTLFCSLAVFSLYQALVLRKFSGWVLAGIAGGLGFMIKGPAAVAMPVATALVYALATRLQRARRSEALSGPGLPIRQVLVGSLVMVGIGVLIGVPWYLAVAARTVATGSQASDEISRLLTESSHKGPLFYYLYILPARMGLWALALPVAVYAAWKRLRRHRGSRWVLCWLGSSFGILSVITAKQTHYALLMFVPAALLTGWLLECAAHHVVQTAETASAKRRLVIFCNCFARGYLRGLICLMAVVGAGGLLVWLGHIVQLPAQLIGLPEAPVLAVISVVTFAAAAMMLRSAKVRSSPLVCVVAMALIIALYAGYYQRDLDQICNGDSAVAALVRDHAPEIDHCSCIRVSGANRAQVEWYAHHRCITAPSVSNGVLDKLQPGEMFVVTGKHLELRPGDPPPADIRVMRNVKAALYIR